MSTPRILCPGCGQPMDPARSASDAYHVVQCSATGTQARTVPASALTYDTGEAS